MHSASCTARRKCRPFEQLVVGAAFRDDAVGNRDDAVGVADGA